MSALAHDAEAARGPRVWILNHYALAPDRAGAAGSRHFDLARRLTGHGQAVTIFAAAFNHVTGRDDRLSPGRLLRRTVHEGVTFAWLRVVAHRGNDWRRPLNMLSYVATFLVAQRTFPRPDVIVGSTVHPFAALAAWLAAKARGARFVLEIRDLWPQTLVDIGALREGSPGERALRALEAFLVRRASVVVTLLPGMADYLTERGLPASHVVYIPNGVDPDAFRGSSAIADETDPRPQTVLDGVRELRAQGRFVVGYVGTFGRVNDVPALVEAMHVAERLAPGRIGLLLVGDGPDRDRVRAAVRGASYVKGFGAVPKRAVPGILASLDATLVHATATPVYRYGISFNKVFEYMAAERPIVFACRSSYDPVARAGAGLTTEPGDPGAIARAMLELAGTSPGRRAAMGTAGRAYVVREHHLDDLGARLARVTAEEPPLFVS